MISFTGRLHHILLLILLSVFFLSGCIENQTHGTAQNVRKNENILRVGVSANAPPMAFKRGNALTGLEIDFASQLSTFLGKEIRFVELDWDKQIPALEEGKIDIIMSGMTITSQRQYRVAFAKPYLRSGQIFLVRAPDARKYAGGIYTLMGGKPAIGTITGTTGDYFITNAIAKPNVERFSTSSNAVSALIQGDIDVFVHDAPIICHYAAINEADQLVPILQMGTEEYLAWAVNKQDTELLNQLNQFVQVSGQNGALQATISKWIPFLNRK